MVDCGGCGDLLEQNDIELQGEHWEETENSEILLEWRMDLRVLNPLRETSKQSRVHEDNSFQCCHEYSDYSNIRIIEPE